MNRFRSAWVLSIVGLLTLIACGTPVEKARTAEEARPKDQMDQSPVKPVAPPGAAAKLEGAPGSNVSGTVTFTPVAGEMMESDPPRGSFARPADPAVTYRVPLLAIAARFGVPIVAPLTFVHVVPPSELR